jgi:fatty-acyl-CoA synthase
VEAVLARHPAVADVAVVGVPDEVMGERVRAAVVMRPGHSLSLEALRGWAGTQLADYKLPVELVALDELPRNPNGKILKRRLAGIQPTGGPS